MSLHPLQQAMLDHFVKLATTNQAWLEYATQRAREMAHKEPKRWGFLPAQLSLRLSESGTATTKTESTTG